MAPRRPASDLKPRACAELALYTVPFCTKEFIQNMVGQVQKALQQREWSSWITEDLVKKPQKEREMRKHALIDQYPGLFTGPHGASLKAPNWLPSFIASGQIPRSEIERAASRNVDAAARNIDTDLIMAVILWLDTATQRHGLSFFNNHLDEEADISSFFVDGASTSRTNRWAVGQKGKGFPLATQFFVEEVELHSGDEEFKNNKKDLGVSFRVGHQVGNLDWRTSQAFGSKRHAIVPTYILRVMVDDLTPLSVEEWLTRAADYNQNHTNKPEDPDSMQKSAESAIKRLNAMRKKQQLDVLDHGGRPLVHDDEVAITVIGLDRALTPEYLLSNVYGIFPPAHSWRVSLSDSEIQFFKDANSEGAQAGSAPDGRPEFTTAKFFHRDQLVPYGIHHLHGLGVNYHGDLSLSSDRLCVLGDAYKRKYCLALGKSADEGFRTIPNLAVELALEILADSHSEGIAGVIQPRDKTGAQAYHQAFESAMRRMHPELAPNADIYPTSSENDTICRELGRIPVVVRSSARSIMSASGAYPNIQDYARALLLSSPSIPPTKGLEHLRKAIGILMPNVPPENVTIREYNKSLPIVAWDGPSKILAFALPPKCDDHLNQRDVCLCWIGPALAHAAPILGKRLDKTFFLAYDAMKDDPVPESNDLEDDMDSEDDMDVDNLLDRPQNAGAAAELNLPQVSSARGTAASAHGRVQPHVPAGDARRNAGPVAGAPSILRAPPPRLAAEPHRFEPRVSLAGPHLPVIPARQPAAAAGAAQAPTRLADLRDPVVAALSHYEELKAQLKIVSSNYDALKAQLARREIEYADLQKKLPEKDARILALEDELKDSRDEVQRMSDKWRKLQQHFNDVDVRDAGGAKRRRTENQE
ncbi:hypothetical protein C8R44DRAFT_741645 [Mycena epipterygia]|nr:hypothetical protein C8R44DRAFT_741645 [Mycena epipterygia]